MATRCLICSKHELKTNEVHATLLGFEPRVWWFSFIDYALHDILSNDLKEAASIRQRSLHFYYDPIVKTLYRRLYDGILLRSLSNSEAQEVLLRHTMVYAELINQVLNLRIDYTNSVIIGQP